MSDNRLGGLFDGTGRNTTLAWLVTLGLCLLALGHALEGSYRWFAFTGVAVAIVVAPAVAFRDPRAMVPWELLLVVALPVANAAAVGESFLTAIAVYLAVAAVALVAVVEIHRFTPARMNHTFAIALVVIATLAVAAVWNVAQWTADVVLGTNYIVGGRSQDAANDALMFDFVYAAVAGLVAGVVFDLYFRMRPASEGVAAGPSDVPVPDGDGRATATAPSLTDRLDVPDSWVRLVSRGLQVALAVVLLYGIVTLDPATIANAGIALAITFLPAVFRRNYRLSLEPELVLWLTGAVFLHSLGSAGLYDVVGQWDTLTHTLSATIVAAAGYAAVRAVDLHTDEVYLPPKLMFAFILLFVMAFGVVWELAEFAIDTTAERFGVEAVLAQYGIDDTIIDLVFDLVGAVVVAAWGSVYLTDVSRQVADRFGG